MLLVLEASLSLLVPFFFLFLSFALHLHICQQQQEPVTCRPVPESERESVCMCKEGQFLRSQTRTHSISTRTSYDHPTTIHPSPSPTPGSTIPLRYLLPSPSLFLVAFLIVFSYFLPQPFSRLTIIHSLPLFLVYVFLSPATILVFFSFLVTLQDTATIEHFLGSTHEQTTDSSPFLALPSLPSIFFDSIHHSHLSFSHFSSYSLFHLLLFASICYVFNCSSFTSLCKGSIYILSCGG
ncbi:MAG: hypothetical protein JOS17DRAFT_759344 [Linnemannia elongata]|nr:MAG: hypothetical protein JOS17DRAFT_759344 [Linnemannia elongata]